MEDYIKEAEDVVLKGDLLRSYDKELAYGDERFREGKEEGKMEGREEGIREGKEEIQKEIIKTMLENRFSDEDILKATKCTKELLEKIKGLEK